MSDSTGTIRKVRVPGVRAGDLLVGIDARGNMEPEVTEANLPGDGWFLGPDLVLQRVRRPADFAAMAVAGTPYILTLNLDGRWIWAVFTGATIVEGLGTRLGVSLGHD